MTEVAKIAEGLSEAQRAALVAGKWATPEFLNLFLGRGISKRTKGTLMDVELTPLGLAVRDHLKGAKQMKSMHSLDTMEVGEARTFDTPTERDRTMIRRSASRQHERTDRRYMTRSRGDTMIVTRLR